MTFQNFRQNIKNSLFGYTCIGKWKKYGKMNVEYTVI